MAGQVTKIYGLDGGDSLAVLAADGGKILGQASAGAAPAQAAAIAAIATADADATYGQPEADLINGLKAKVNLLLAACRNAGSSRSRNMFDARLKKPLGYQQITTLTTAVGLTVPPGAVGAIIVAEAQAVRWRDDGTAPTATVGMPLAVAAALEYAGDLSAIKFIEQTAGAKLNVAYY